MPRRVPRRYVENMIARKSINMSLAAYLSNSQLQFIAHPEPPKATDRFRSACNSCHRAKIKCSGVNPCLTYLPVSRDHCNYSPSSRLGRPKGSKNKRARIRENKNKCDKSLQVEFAPKYGIDSNPPEDIIPHIDPNPLPFNTNLIPFINPICTIRVDANLEPSLSALFSEPPYNELLSGTPESACDCGRYTTTTDWAQIILDVLDYPIAHVSSSKSSYLVYQLGESQIGIPYELSYPGYFLHGVQLAQGPWNYLMKCGRCQSRGNLKEIFLLFATSIRILLSSFEQLNASCPRVDKARHSSMA
ncbi:hypothetical protein K449DRAFT_403083 [Hypoxylon sp. EC38]|nr:hypothetical protein K449DRAFT_403083 [Hypoxylon sp. EC38]